MRYTKIYNFISALCTYCSILCFISLTEVQAQQDPLFTHYITNRMLLNPAYTGYENLSVATAMYRTQWVNKIDGAPKTYTISFHTPIYQDKIGIGAYYVEDKIGPVTEREFTTSYAYHIDMENKKLSFGLQFGFKYLKQSPMGYLGNTSDPIYNYLFGSAWKPNFSIGAQFKDPKYFVGFSAKDLLNQDYETNDNDGSNITTYKTAIHYYLMGGIYFQVHPNWMLRPSTLLKYVKHADIDFDITVMTYFKERFSAGVSMRSENAVAGLLQVEIIDNLWFGYSYDYYYNSLNSVNSGSHEISLEYGFHIKPKENNSRVKNPRYF